MDAALVPLLLALLGRAARAGTLGEIVEAFAKLVRLVEPLLATAPDGPTGR